MGETYAINVLLCFANFTGFRSGWNARNQPSCWRRNCLDRPPWVTACRCSRE